MALGMKKIKQRIDANPAAAAFLALPWRQRARLAGRLVRDSRVHPAARIGFPILILYLLSPIDLIPDFIPVLGYVDDLLILLLALWAFSKLVPQEIVLGHARDLGYRPGGDRRDSMHKSNHQIGEPE